ncbi:MAG: hypothetical protein HY010_12235 [Acidobacteria bacterium]|nr:hypothetical protein [Acidobacteriota bacterium]
MSENAERGGRSRSVVVVLILAASMLAGTASAGKKDPTYPEEGKITATTVNQVPVTTYAQANGTTMAVKSIKYTRIYTVQTETKTYDLDCGKTPHIFSRTPGECGGTKKIQVGDSIHFRLQKGWAYIPITEINEGKEESREQKLRVVNEELKEGEAATPAKTDAKPPVTKQ